MSEEHFKDCYLFRSEVLPQGFRFPEAYLKIIAEGKFPDFDPWWFLAMDRIASDFWLSTLKEQYPNRLLVPFAKRGDHSDELAAFDGADTSGKPKVLLIHAYTDPGWEHRATWDSFEEWMEQAKRDAAEFEAENE